VADLACDMHGALNSTARRRAGDGRVGAPLRTRGL